MSKNKSPKKDKELQPTDSKGSVKSESTVGKTGDTDNMKSSPSSKDLANDITSTLNSLAGKPNSEGASDPKTDTGNLHYEKADWKTKQYANDDTKRKNNRNKTRGHFDKRNKSGNTNSGSSSSLGDVEKVKNGVIDTVANSDSRPRIDNRTITEVEAPNTDSLSRLTMDKMSPNGTIRLREGVDRAKQFADNKTGNLGDTFTTDVPVTDISKIEWKIIPRGTMQIKEAPATKSQGFYTGKTRYNELDQPIVNLKKAKPVISLGDNGWPYSSTFGNPLNKKPYLPQVIDDILVISLNGGAIIREGNVLKTTPSWDRSVTQFIIPGVTGYFYYPTQSDVDMGKLVAHYRKVEQFRGIMHVLVGDKFTSSKNIWKSSDATTSDNAVISLKGNYEQIIAEKLSDEDKVGGIKDENDFYNYPDNQYQTISLDSTIIYLRHLNAVKTNKDPMNNPLAGFLDEQAFYYALQSVTNLTTFFWCYLIAFEKAWYNAGYMQAKLGVSAMTDLYLQSMPKSGRNGRLQFVRALPEILNGLPYNENTVQAFRQWCDTTMSDAQLDQFDELNPMLSFRVVFSALEDIGAPVDDSLVSFISDITSGKAKKSATYWPHVTAAKSSELTSLASATRLETAPFAMFVKSLITQVPMAVPNGDWLKNFLQYFGNFIYYSRLPDFYPGGSKTNNFNGDSKAWAEYLMNPDNNFKFTPGNIIKGRDSWTTILDPKHLTGFMISFTLYGGVINKMVDWMKQAKEIALQWVLYIRSLFPSKDGNASYCFKQVKLRGITDSSYFYVEKQPFLQHILSRYRQTTRIAGYMHFLHNGVSVNDGTTESSSSNPVVKALASATSEAAIISNTALKAAVVVPHMPNLTKAMSPDYNVKSWNAARVGFPLSRSYSNFDFGTTGDVFYNSFNPIAKKNGTSSFLDSIQNAATKKIIQDKVGQSGTFVSADELSKPWDLYEQYYYFSMMVMPYYPRKGWTILPGYDYFYSDSSAKLDSATKMLGDIYQAASSSDLNPFRRDLQFTNFNVFKDAYEEIYDVDELANKVITDFRPATSAMRFVYGSSNRINVKFGQEVSSDALGFPCHYMLLSRINAISIFTANNSELIGIANSLQHLKQSENLIIPYVYYTTQLQSLLGLPYIPFMGIGSGGSLVQNVFEQCVYYFVEKISTADLDLSTKFRNLTFIMSNQNAGEGLAEAFPSIDGFGRDLLAHPQDQNKIDLFNINNMSKGGQNE